jgi:enoyl-CoA hydratase/carnithine racemase
MLRLSSRRLLSSSAARSSFSSSAARPSFVTVDRPGDGRVAIVTLNDPPRLNALNADMGDEFAEIVRDFQEGPESKNLGAVVLTGAGRAFSAGGDLGFLKDRGNDTPSRNSVIMRRFYERFLSVRRLPVPVVAAINGPAIGAGLALALACDVRVARHDAKMGITFVQLGLHPGMGSTHFLPRIVGPQQASKLMLTGEIVDGVEAHRIGMVAEVVHENDSVGREDDGVASTTTLEAATKMARRMATAAPLAVRTCVRSIRMAQDDGLDRSLWREADAQAQVWNSRDLHEGVDALVEKRRAEFCDFEHLQE